MLGVQRGDPHSFEKLVLNYQQRLNGFFYRLVGPSAPIDDLTQEVFLRIYRSRSAYAPTARFSAWLFRIANNVALTHLRRNPAGQTVDVDADHLANIAPDASSAIPTRIFEKLENDQSVRAAIECLSLRERTAIIMSKYEGLSYAEISTALDCSVPAVRSLLSRARARLRDLLVGYVNDGQWPTPGDS